MQSVTGAPNLTGRRLVGSALYALTIMAVSLPIIMWIAGLVIGPQALRKKILFSSADFAFAHGGAGMFLVILTTFVLSTLYNFAVGPRQRYDFNWSYVPRLFDDSLSAREKVAAMLASGWGRVMIAVDLLWLAMAVTIPYLDH
jgi:hypothetical protein